MSIRLIHTTSSVTQKPEQYPLRLVPWRTRNTVREKLAPRGYYQAHHRRHTSLLAPNRPLRLYRGTRPAPPLCTRQKSSAALSILKTPSTSRARRSCSKQARRDILVMAAIVSAIQRRFRCDHFEQAIFVYRPSHVRSLL